MKRSRSLIVLMTVAVLLFAFAGLAVAAEADDAAERLEGFGVIEGYPDGTMGLEREITRAEFAKIAVVAKGLEEAADLLQANPSQFSDVQTNVWYTGWVNVANAQGIVKGDPVGTFRPNDNISVAEAVAMILRTLGYNDNLPGAWPTNYLVKGADLGITTGIVTNANANALRGDVFTMLNRALDEDVVAWEYEDKSSDADFNKKGYTLIQEMKNAKEKTEGRITANARTNDRYKANEVYVTVDKDDEGKSGKFTIMSGDSVDYLLGLEVELFHNKDDEVYYINIETRDSDIVYDSVVSATERDVKLDVEDDTFRWENDVETAFVNFETEDVENLEPGQYGKFVMDGKRVVFASVFDFGNNIGVVTDVDGDVVEYIANDATEQELDLDDADELVILTPEFNAADVDDIDENSAIFYWSNDDDEYFVIVKNEVVEGEVDSVQAGKARIDGTNYDKADDAVITTDGDDYYVWNNLGDIEDLNGEEVIAVLDLNGDILLISGNADSAKMFGVITYADLARNGEITVVNADDKEVTYKFEKRGDFVIDLAHDNKDFNYYGDLDKGDLKYAVASFKLNSDGEIREDTFTVVAIDGDEVDEDIKQIGDKNEFEIYAGLAEKDVDDKFVKIGTTRYYIDNNTVIFKALDRTDKDLDPAVQKNDDIIKSSFTDGGESAVVFTEEGKRDAKFIVFLDADFEGSGDDSFFGIVTANPEKKGDNWYADIDVFGEGKDNYRVEDEDDFARGNLVEFRVKSNGEAYVYDDNFVVFEDGTSSVVEGKSSGYLEIDDANYKLENSAVVYEEKDAGKRNFGSKRSAGRIAKGDSILYLLENEDVIKAAMILKAAGPTGEQPGETDEGVVTYINETRLFVDGERYTLDEDTVLFAADEETILAVGGEDIDGLVEVDDIVDITEVKDGVVVEMVLVQDTSAKEAADALAEAVEAAETALEAHLAAGGEETDAEYAAVVAALEADPQVRADIESATEALEGATQDLLDDAEALQDAKDALEAAIEDAETLLAIYESAEGTGLDLAIDEIEGYITAAETVLDNEDATLQELEDALTTLENEIKTDRFLYDVNDIGGEGKMSVILGYLENAEFDALNNDDAKEEVARVFIINRTSSFSDFDEIEPALEEAVEEYLNLLDRVNTTAVAGALEGRLQDAANAIFASDSFTVTPEMAQAIWDAENFGSFESFAEIIEVLQDAGL